MTSQRSRREALALAVVLAVSLSFVFSGAKCGGNRPPHRTQEQIRIDDDMTGIIRANLTAASPEIRAADIGVNTFLLVVKLEGKVRSENERNRAIQIARDSVLEKDGTSHRVKEVKADRLTVQP